jgi:arylformamidase
MSDTSNSLEHLYNNRAAVPDHPAIFARWAAQSATTRAAHRGHCNLAYGPHAKQTLALFPAPNSKGLAIFIHGGYWRSLDKDDFSFLAEPYLIHGISFASINYRLCPEVRIGDIVEDCESAITWLAKHAHEYDVDFSRNVLLGHSAGAHLVTMMYCTDWAARGVDAASFIGGVGVSGVYDLAPLLHVSMNADLKLDASAAQQLSPIHHQPRLDVPFDLIVGADETSEFVRQTSLLPKAWPQQAHLLETAVARNHFTIVDHFSATESIALKRTLAWLYQHT